MYILQITKRRIGPVLAFNVQIPDQVECLAVFAYWKQAQDLCVSLLFVQHLYIIFQYVTQNSTFTRQNTLSFVILVFIIMYTLVSGVHDVCNKDSIHQARLAQSVEHQTLNRRVEGSSPTVDKTFFILYFVASDALLAGRLAPCKWNQAWRPSELYMCIEREKVDFKSREVNCLKECALALNVDDRYYA